MAAMNSLTNIKATRWFIISIILYAASLVMPFLEDSTGAKFFIKGLGLLVDGKLTQEYWVVFAAFYIPLFCFPIFVAWWLLQKKYSKRIFAASIVLLLFPHIIVFVKIAGRGLQRTMADWNMLGYSCWLLGFLTMVLAIYCKESPKESTDDFSQHLIEEDY